MRECPEDEKIVALMKEKRKKIFCATLLPKKLRHPTPPPWAVMEAPLTDPETCTMQNGQR
jgi:hypothetical protein